MTKGLIVIFVTVAIGVVASLSFQTSKNGRCTAPKNACINNLRQIDGAKEQWALESKRSLGERVMEKEMVQYIKGGQMPKCSEAGRYLVGRVGVAPRCTVNGHALEP
jgi:hypothetical protein